VYVEKLIAKLDEINAEMEKLAEKAGKEDTKAKIKYQKQLEDLRAKRKDVVEKLAELRQAGESAWEDLKHGLENTFEILKTSFSKAKTEFERGYREGREE
jgi:hypothetical protein